MSITELSFSSTNERDMVKAWLYTPLGTPKGIIQLVHGFGEHSRRYLHMIGKFQAAGFIVAADDHIGHGKTGKDSNTLGDPHSKDYMTYIHDEHTLHNLVVAQYPGLPFYMFGHSWGSMIARGYASCYGEDLSGLMLCGVVSQMKGCEKLRHSVELEEAVKENPYAPAGKWFDLAFEGMTDRYENVISPADWIAKDHRIVEDHAGDPFNTFQTTLQLVYDLVKLYDMIEDIAWAKKVPTHVPVYLIAGDQDPCGNYGEGLYHVANLLAETGHKVSVKAYAGYRHEIHNELDLRDKVEDGLIQFIVQGIL